MFQAKFTKAEADIAQAQVSVAKPDVDGAALFT